MSQFLKAPTQHHWSACKRLLRYVSGTRTLGLSFRPTTRFTLEGFSDADWACNVDDRRYTTGYCVFLGGNLVTWSSRKQQVIARSNTESKYRALASVTMELIWIKSLLDELQFPLQHRPIAWCENLGAHALAHNPIYHSRTKHIEVDVHFIREKILHRALEVCYIPSQEQQAELFTKSLSLSQFQFKCSKLSLSYPPFNLRGMLNNKTSCTSLCF